MYKLGQVAAAVGMNARTLGDWIDRGIVEAPRTGTGRHRDFGIREADRIALIHELTKIGLPVADAARAVSAFSDERGKCRPKAQLYRDGAKTILLVTEEGASVVAADDQEAFESAMTTVYSDVRTVTLLNVGEVLSRLDAAFAAGTHTPKPPAGAIYRHGRQLHT
jgi:DNA-binding transcriptional MerR regulator